MNDEWARAIWGGIAGAGFSAVIALVVLLVSIGVQRHHQREQLQKLDEHHQEQLKEQDRSLTAQLEAQRRENAEGRINVAVGQLLSGIAAVSTARSTSGQDVQVANRCFVPLEQLLLDLSPADAEGFGTVVRDWLRHICYAPLEKFQTETHKHTTFAYMTGQTSLLLDRIPRWIRADPAYRKVLEAEMRNAYAVATKGLTAWNAVYDNR